MLSKNTFVKEEPKWFNKVVYPKNNNDFSIKQWHTNIQHRIMYKRHIYNKDDKTLAESLNYINNNNKYIKHIDPYFGNSKNTIADIYLTDILELLLNNFNKAQLKTIGNEISKFNDENIDEFIYNNEEIKKILSSNIAWGRFKNPPVTLPYVINKVSYIEKSNPIIKVNLNNNITKITDDFKNFIDDYKTKKIQNYNSFKSMGASYLFKNKILQIYDLSEYAKVQNKTLSTNLLAKLIGKNDRQTKRLRENIDMIFNKNYLDWIIHS